MTECSAVEQDQYITVFDLFHLPPRSVVHTLSSLILVRQCFTITAVLPTQLRQTNPHRHLLHTEHELFTDLTLVADQSSLSVLLNVFIHSPEFTD